VKITVLRPDSIETSPARVSLAPRAELPDEVTIGLVSNGKPFAAELLTMLAEKIERRTRRRLTVELVRKPSSTYPIPDDEATLLAARCHVVVAGIGD
jgi:hypothetical protein